MLDNTTDFNPVRDAYPGSAVPLYVPGQDDSLLVATLAWPPLDGRPRAVFITRIESALEQFRSGYRGMRVRTIAYGCLLAPVHDCIPFVLRPGESSVWPGLDFSSLADRCQLWLFRKSRALAGSSQTMAAPC